MKKELEALNSRIGALEWITLDLMTMVADEAPHLRPVITARLHAIAEDLNEMEELTEAQFVDEMASKFVTSN